MDIFAPIVNKICKMIPAYFRLVQNFDIAHFVYFERLEIKLRIHFPFVHFKFISSTTCVNKEYMTA